MAPSRVQKMEDLLVVLQGMGLPIGIGQETTLGLWTVRLLLKRGRES